ncbi:MAG TPA: metal-dependent hydrolase, partial [Bacteroidota bacterium]|nr:metal-dependent hydrolase [Bacteroidota bacterium]
MPTIISHGFFAVVTGRMFSKAVSLKFVTLSVLCSILPDADVVGFSLGVPYGSVLGHRGFSHSLVFALLVAVFVVLFAFRETRRFTRAWWSLLGYFFVVTASHGVLDAATDGGLGVGFLLPFDSARYFFPFRPVH